VGGSVLVGTSTIVETIDNSGTPNAKNRVHKKLDTTVFETNCEPVVVMP